jgi:hypothetical protein
MVAAVEPLLHRPDLELPLANVLEVLGRPEEHVDQRPEERRHGAEHRRHRHEPGIVDPAARVLVHPEDRRDPEDDHEEDREIADDEPGAGLEEVSDSSEQPVVLCSQDHAFSLEEQLPDDVAGGKREPDDRSQDDRGEREDAQLFTEPPHRTSSSRTI